MRANDGVLPLTDSIFEDDEEGWPSVLSYWRTLPAEAFGPDIRSEIVSYVRKISSTMTDWRAAVEGNSGAACGLALRMPVPQYIGPRVDLIMTVLLCCAFENAGAALVLSSRLEQMPLRPRDRARLSTSWKVHNLYLARRSYGRRSLPSTFIRREDGR